MFKLNLLLCVAGVFAFSVSTIAVAMPVRISDPSITVAANGRDVAKEFADKFADFESKYRETLQKNNLQFKDDVEKYMRSLDGGKKWEDVNAVRDNVYKRIESKDYAGAADAISSRKNFPTRLKTIGLRWERLNASALKDYESGLKKLENDMLRRIDIHIMLETKSNNTASVTELKYLRDTLFPPKPTQAELDSFVVKPLPLPHHTKRFHVFERHDPGNGRTEGHWVMSYWMLHHQVFLTGQKDVTAIKLLPNDIFHARRGNDDFVPAGTWRAADDVLKLEWTAFKAVNGKTVIESFDFPVRGMELVGKASNKTALKYVRDVSTAPHNTNLPIARLLTQNRWILTTESMRTTTPVVVFASDGTGLINFCRNNNPNDYERSMFFQWKIQPLGRIEIKCPYYEPVASLDIFDNTLTLTYRSYNHGNKSLKKEVYKVYEKPHGVAETPIEDNNDGKRRRKNAKSAEKTPKERPERSATKPADKPVDTPEPPVKDDEKGFDF